MMSSHTNKQPENTAEISPRTDTEELELTIRFRELESIELVCNEDMPILKTLFQALISNAQASVAQQDALIYLELGGDDPKVLYFPRSQLLTIETNRPVSEEILYEKSAVNSADESLPRRGSPFDDSWKYWIWNNVNRGCSKHGMFQILLENGFAADDIRFELEYDADMGTEHLASDFTGEPPEWDMRDPDPALVRLAVDEIEAYEFNNFLSPSECEQLVDIMKNNHTRSMVSSEENAEGVVDECRTSSSTFFDTEDSFVQNIEQKIANAIGIDIKYGEAMQGQSYEVGGLFKEHLDYFGKNNESIYQNYCQNGDRTWTLVIYLNDEGLEGGETYFPKADLRVKPSIGKAVCWRNMNPNGSMNSSTLHSGLPPTKGSKYIITKWFREESVGTYSDETKKQYFSTISDLPYLDKNGIGFEKRKLPEHILKLVQEAYDRLKPKLEQEQWDGLTDYISNSENNAPCDIMSFDHFPEMKDRIHKELQAVVQQWIGTENPIIPSDLYGIRSYKSGAKLKMHSDRFQTHHAGCIVMVDKKVDEDWPLHCVDHNGKTHKVYLEPGEIALYECAKTVHGRPDPLVGDWFRNFFVHYKLENWEYREPASALAD